MSGGRALSSSGLESRFEFPVVVLNALVAAVVGKEAERQTVHRMMVHNTVAALTVVGASRFRTGALLFILASHKYIGIKQVL